MHEDCLAPANMPAAQTSFAPPTHLWPTGQSEHELLPCVDHVVAAHADFCPSLQAKPAGQIWHVRSLDGVAALVWNCPAAHGARTARHVLPSPTAENVAVPSHAPQERFAFLVPAAVWPAPTPHVRHAVHEWLPGALLKVPSAHAPHLRLEDALGAAVSYSPAWHTVMAAHTRSDVGVGATRVHCPTGHLTLCVMQSRSLLAVGAPRSYSMAVHFSTGVQASPFVASEKLTPTSHAAHLRFEVAVPSTSRPKPGRHTAHAEHVVYPAAEVNVPSGQALHTRSLLAVAETVIW